MAANQAVINSAKAAYDIPKEKWDRIKLTGWNFGLCKWYCKYC